MASQGHPMAQAFEKAVADKMNMRGGSKQSTAKTYPKLGHMNGSTGNGKVGQSTRGFMLHPKNKTKVSAKRGMSSNGPMA